MEILELINQSSNLLKNKNIVTHKLDAELILSKVLNKTREDLLINQNQKVNSFKVEYFNKLIERRSKKEPIAYILNKREFWSKNFKVNKHVLIPRPETELMVEMIINVFNRKRLHLLDIGTGTGCILLSVLSELENSRGLGIDISKEAIYLARRNAQQHNLSNRAKFCIKSVNNFFNQKFDLIVSNPPYIKKNEIRNLDDDIKKFEPKLALDGGNDGLDVIKKVIYKSKYILKINGMLALEIGNEQYKQVSNILKKNGFKTKYLVKDYRENIRCILSILK